MARGRMLNRKISQDEKVAKLSVEAALLYTWMIPHADVRGRIYGNPAYLKGNIVPHVAGIDIDDIEGLISEISAAGLICYYGDTVKYIQLLGWENNQNVNPDREAESEIPKPTPEQLKSNSGVTPAKEKLREEKLRERDTTTLEPFIMAFPVTGKDAKEWGLTENKVQEYSNSFPGLDILKECRTARQWCIDNPSRRKTFRGMPAFLSRWLTKQQNRGGSNGFNSRRRGSGLPGSDEEARGYDGKP